MNDYYHSWVFYGSSLEWWFQKGRTVRDGKKVNVVDRTPPDSYGAYLYTGRGGAASRNRPAWENVILKRIDDERKGMSWVKQREAQLERNNRGPSEKEKAEAAEAATLRAFRARAHSRGVEEAKRLGSRHADSVGQSDVRSWHAPRTPEGLPEGVTIEEEK